MPPIAVSFIHYSMRMHAKESALHGHEWRMATEGMGCSSSHERYDGTEPVLAMDYNPPTLCIKQFNGFIITIRRPLPRTALRTTPCPRQPAPVPPARPAIRAVLRRAGAACGSARNPQMRVVLNTKPVLNFVLSSYIYIYIYIWMCIRIIM